MVREGDSLEVSVIIPTKNRMESLRELLCTLIGQTMLPKEIIIVDDSDGDETKKLVGQKQEGYLGEGIVLRYLRGKKKKSISAARNIGAANAAGDIILFLDDDVILANNFVSEIVKVYETRSNTKGVQGNITNYAPLHSAFIRAIDRVLLCFPRLYCEPNKCTAFPFVYPYPVTQLIECEWAIGANSSYKKEVLQDFKFDENFRGYSLCEDIDLSYRIQRRYPHSIYMTPSAKLVHKQSLADRILDEYFIYTMTAYPTYFFCKNIRQTITNCMVFYWGLFVGRFIQETFIRKNMKRTILMIKATFQVLKGFQEIRKGNLTRDSACTAG
jgi:glycosyltransferase involved in cell wall biosynthesis